MKKWLLFIATCAFAFNLSAQTQIGSDIDGETAGDLFGGSVSISEDGSRMAIGARNNIGSGTNSGNVRIFGWKDSGWAQIGSDIDGEADGDNFGFALSLSADGNRIAIGARYNGGNGTRSGHARIYEWDGISWTQMGIDIDGEEAEGQFGYSVSLDADGNRVAIGARYNDGNGTDSGHVRLYDWNGSAWTQVGSDIDGEAAGDKFGKSISLSDDGSRVVIGARYNDGNGTDSGHVRIYDWNGSAWVQVGSDIDGEAAGDGSGFSVSLSSDGNRVAVGATKNDGNGTDSGHVRIFDWNGSAWVQVGNDIDGEMAGDKSSDSVSLSNDGSVIAIGAKFNDGNGTDSGHVRLYQWNGNAWVQLGNDIDGEAAGDRSGISVSLSVDGSRVAIGALYNNGNGIDAGHIRVYNNYPCSGYYQIPTTAGTYTSTVTSTSGGWKHYCDENSNLLLSLDVGSSGAVVADDEVQLKIENPTATYYTQGCGSSPACFMSLKYGAVSFDRKWEVNPTTQPSSGNVGVKYYFTQSEYDALNTETISQGHAQINGMNKMWFYKVTNNGLGSFPNIPNITESDVQKIYNDSSTPATNQWVLNTKITESEYFAEYEVSSFSGGGGGGIGNGQLTYFTSLGDIDGEAAGDESGNSVSISSDGSRVAIGARYNDGTDIDAGHVRVYDWNGSSWIQVGSDIDGEAAGDNSGKSVSISSDGTRIGIGATSNEGSGSNSGHVRVYDWNGSVWVQVGSDIDGEADGDYFGNSISFSEDGSRIGIGGTRNDGNGPDAGHVRVYDWNGSSWVQVGNDIEGEAELDKSGRSVSLSADGSRVAIGAWYNDGNGPDAGHVRVYDWNGSSWVQVGNDIDGEAAGDESGHSVSLSADGSRIAIGAKYSDGNGPDAGQVRIYNWYGSVWVQTGSDIDGEAAGDNFGSSVSLSANGNILAIGAKNNDGNGVDAGHVRLYEWDGSDWSQLDNDIDGEATGDQSGLSVSLSSDGSRVAIGSSKNDGNGTDAGHVRVYNNYICSSDSPIPTTAGTYTSTYSRISGDWTHYCNTDNELLLSLDLGSSGATVADDEVTLKIGSSVTDYYAQDCGASPPCFVDLTSGAVTFNREWDVNPTTQPSSDNVGVKFYFTQTEYDSVNARINDMGETQLTGIDQLWFYKVTNAALGQFPSIDNVTQDDVLIMQNHASTPATSQWVQSTKTIGSEYIAQFLVSSFSGGGGGGAENGLTPLPIELIYFHAYADEGDVQLKWATASELYNRGFEIQRSQNGLDWNALDFKTGAGTVITTQHYNYTDTNPNMGMNYYRLQQVDFDGKTEYLPIQVVDIQQGEHDVIEIFPNPAKDFLNITNVKGKGMIYNMAGQLVKEVVLAEDGINTIQINDLHHGMYQIMVIQENGDRVMERFSK